MADSIVEDASRVTIVTPSYNQGRFIRATIESVLSQNYPNIEYIVMDAGSTDETSSIVREYSSRLVFNWEPDRGQSHAIKQRLSAGERESVGMVELRRCVSSRSG
jgi:glycosyltransferase involved in cell wall biosynthesis